MEMAGNKFSEQKNSEKQNPDITYLAVRSWDDTEIIDLYRAGGWWEMGWSPAGIAPLMRGSFLFIIALDTTTGHAVGMGRIIADGSSDGYIQDVVVHHTTTGSAESAQQSQPCCADSAQHSASHG